MPIGTTARSIGLYETPRLKCDHCGERWTHEVNVFGHYAHIILIPLFPTERSYTAECGNCHELLYQDEFNPTLQEICKESKHVVRRPWTHYLGLGILGIIIAFSTLNVSKEEVDYRKNNLALDISLMSTFPATHNDTISDKIQSAFAKTVTMDVDPSYFKYISDIRGDRALVLVTIPELGSIKESSLSDAIVIIESVTSTQGDLQGKKMYIGVRDNRRLRVLKTPTYYQVGDEVNQTAIYGFYGNL
ncbi:MAG: hypothetical protein AB8F78_01595 [Saprospiraceae bacterium]